MKKRIVSDPPVNVAIPNTSKEKMQAIVALCNAIEDMARTLNSTNVEVKVSNNTISSAKVGINISTDDKK